MWFINGENGLHTEEPSDVDHPPGMCDGPKDEGMDELRKEVSYRSALYRLEIIGKLKNSQTFIFIHIVLSC